MIRFYLPYLILFFAAQNCAAQINITSFEIHIENLHLRSEHYIYRRFDNDNENSEYYGNISRKFVPNHLFIFKDSIKLAKFDTNSWDPSSVDTESVVIHYDSTKNRISKLFYRHLSQAQYGFEGYLTEIEISNLFLSKDSSGKFVATINDSSINSNFKYHYSYFLSGSAQGQMVTTDEFIIDTTGASQGTLILEGSVPLSVSNHSEINANEPLIFPNPNPGIFRINNVLNVSSLKILTLSGFALESHQLYPGMNSLYTSMPDGIYWAQYENQIEKIIIQH
jgi:hypothetical protein